MLHKGLLFHLLQCAVFHKDKETIFHYDHNA
jgi:hypothetical protein